MPTSTASQPKSSEQPTTSTAHSSHDLPNPPSLLNTLGPSFILLGLALGSGELIMWPYLSANYGLGLLWGALLGISLQYILNTEVMRYTLAWGESIFVGLSRFSKWIPVWFILSTFIPWSLPGFSSASSQIVNRFFPALSPDLITVAMLILTGVLLTAGKTLYDTMETFEKFIVFASIPFIIFLVWQFSEPADWAAAARGIVGSGDGWWFFPPGIALGSFLGAFAYSGGGGNLNLAQSHYIKEKGFGMGAYAPKIQSFLTAGTKAVQLEGQTFDDTPENQTKWKEWWRLISTEHAIVFWGTGFLGIVLLTILSSTLVYGTPAEAGLSFLYIQAEAIAAASGSFLSGFYLLAVALMLFSTQVIVLEASSRIISENVILLFHDKGEKFNVSMAFYIALWAQIALGIVLLLLGLNEPRFVLTLAAIFNAAAMMVAFPLILWLNRKRLRPAQRPGSLRTAGMVMGFLLFVGLVMITLGDFRI